MGGISLPPDLADFLAAGLSLSYDASACEFGMVKFAHPNSLRMLGYPSDMDNADFDTSEDPHQGKMGCYIVPAVSLIVDAEDYDPEGLFLWIPDFGCYGTWDSSHDLVLGFPQELRWQAIAQDPLGYLNAQWEEEGSAEARGLCPLEAWRHCKYSF